MDLPLSRSRRRTRSSGRPNLLARPPPLVPRLAAPLYASLVGVVHVVCFLLIYGTSRATNPAHPGYDCFQVTITGTNFGLGPDLLSDVRQAVHGFHLLGCVCVCVAPVRLVCFFLSPPPPPPFPSSLTRPTVDYPQRNLVHRHHLACIGDRSLSQPGRVRVWSGDCHRGRRVLGRCRPAVHLPSAAPRDRHLASLWFHIWWHWYSRFPLVCGGDD